MIKVGWCYAGASWNQLIGKDPEHVETLNKAGSKASLCPALQDAVENLYQIPSPFKFHMSCKLTKEGEASVTLHQDSTLMNKTFDQMIQIHHSNEWGTPSRPLLQILTQILFVADEDVWMETFMPIFHYRNNPLPIRQAFGRYNICDWQRPISCAFEWVDISKEIIIEEGEPLFYVRFLEPTFSKKITLKKIKFSGELKKHSDMCKSLVDVVKNTKNYFKIHRLMRPKRYHWEKK